MKKQITTIQELIEFAESIPEELWIVNSLWELGNPKSGKSCFMGHINRNLHGSPSFVLSKTHYWTTNWPMSTSEGLIKDLGLDPRELIKVNNGYQDSQGTPKSRVINYLKAKLN